MSTVKVNKIEKRSGSTLTLGGPGTAVTLACGATQTGFGRTGTVDWCTTAKTSPLTVASGNGYFINTSGGVITVTLPSSPSAGDIVAFKDYANTWDTNKVTVARNGSLINGANACAFLSTESQSVTLIYVDGTKGWQDIHDSTSNITGNDNIVATGGTITTCGNFKIHTFTSSSDFIVSAAPNPAKAKVSYVVVAGGGGGGGESKTTTSSGGGGAGGYREGKISTDPYTASPLAATPCSSLPVSVQTYPITVGAGGTAGPGTPGAPNNSNGGAGAVSTFSSITSAGGGYGSGINSPCLAAGSGGSGGGAKQGNNAGPANGGGLGNTPPVSPPQGNNGGQSDQPGGGAPTCTTYKGGGGGGAGAVGGKPTAVPGPAGVGGAGVTSSITGAGTARAGGGGAGASAYPGACNALPGPGGAGGGGAGGNTSGGAAATVNTGGGGGGANNAVGGPSSVFSGGAGGSGIVVIRYQFQ